MDTHTSICNEMSHIVKEELMQALAALTLKNPSSTSAQCIHTYAFRSELNL
jgi:hypothetical protein